MFLGFIKSKNDETSHESCLFFIILFYFDLLLLKVYNINNNASAFGCFKRKRNDLFAKFGSESVWSGSVYAMHMMFARIFELYFVSVNVIWFSTASCSLPLSLFIFLAHHFGFFTSFGVCVCCFRLFKWWR